jgi:hypothetical protein
VTSESPRGQGGGQKVQCAYKPYNLNSLDTTTCLTDKRAGDPGGGDQPLVLGTGWQECAFVDQIIQAAQL